jgi:hypothetical protein
MQSMKWVWSIVVGVLLSAGCVDVKSSLSPTAPSAVSAAVLHQDDAGGVSGTMAGKGNGSNPGNGNGGGNGNNPGGGKPDDKGKPDDPGNGKQPPPNTSPGTPAPPAPPTVPPTTPPSTVTKVEIEGLIGGIAGNAITVNSRSVAVPDAAIIRHGNRALLFSQLQVGDRVHVKGRSITGGIEATEVKVQNPEGDGNDDDPNEDGSATVTVSLADASASETGGDTGAFRLTRTPTTALPLASPLTVSFTLAGTATNGVDYSLLPLTATFAAGQSTVDVVVAPTLDPVAEGNETVVLTLTNAAPYTLGSPASATVTISEAPAVTVAAFDSSASEIGLDKATFRLTRAGSTAAALTVTYTLGGTATNGVDYEMLSLTVTFTAGSATADVVVTPLVDAVREGIETVIITLIDGAAYDLATPATATATIAG